MDRLVDLVERGGITLPDRNPETGQEATRHLDYGDVAILCRAATSFPFYEDALGRRGSPTSPSRAGVSTIALRCGMW